MTSVVAKPTMQSTHNIAINFFIAIVFLIVKQYET